jgi:hypothetical protein
MSDEQGRITRWYAAGTDIEELKLAEQRLQEENVSLREEIDKASMFEEIVGTSAPLKKVLSPSVITSNPATCDHPKTGQRTEPRNIDSCTAPTRVPARAFCCPARNVLLPARKIP